MADEIIIDVQVNTDEVQQKLSAAIKDLGELKDKQKELTKSIKEGKDANGEQAKSFAENEAKIKSDQAAIKSLTAALQVSSRVTADNAGKIDTQNMTLDEQRQLLGQLQKAYGGLTPEQKKSTETGKLLSEQIDALNESVVKQEEAIGDHRRLVGSYKDAITQAFNQMGSGLRGFLGNLKAFFANPWAALVGAIVIAFRALVDAFKGSEDRMRELQTAFAPFEGVINTGKQALDAFAKVIGGVVVEALGKMAEGMNWLLEQIDAFGEFLGKDWDFSKRVQANAEAAKQIAAQDQALIDKKRAFQVEEAQLNNQISELRAKAAEKDKYTTDQSIAFMERARDLELELANKRKSIAEDELQLAEKRAAQSENDAAANDALAAAQANVINQTTAYNNKVRELNGTIAELTKQTEEYKATLSAGDLVLTDEEVQEIVASYMTMGAKVAATMEELQEEYGVNLLKREDEEEEDIPDPTVAAARIGWTEEALDYYKDLLSQGVEAHTAFTQAQQKNNEILAAQEKAMQAEREKALKNAVSVYANTFGQISNMLAQYGKENEAASKASKAFAMMQVLLANGVSIAEGAKGMAAGMASAAATPFPANIAAIISVVAQIGAIVGTVASTIAQAKQIVQGANAGSFEGGGVIKGNSYTGDKLTANVNSNEVILNPEQQANTLFNMAQARYAIEQFDFERMQACIEAALMKMPNPVLVYSEFDDFTQGVESNKVIYTVTQ